MESLFFLSVLGAAAVFAGASVATETMYQRHLWFLLGVALAMPARRSKAGEPLGAEIVRN